MESQFHLANITKSATKYHHILSLLPEEIAAELPLTDPVYEDLKSSILEGLKANRHQLIEQALAAVELGRKRPTQLVNEIKKRFCDIGLTPNEYIIKSRLLSALPPNICAALVGHDSQSLDAYTRIADSMVAVATPAVDFTIGAVSSSHDKPTFQRYDKHKFRKENYRGDENYHHHRREQFPI